MTEISTIVTLKKGEGRTIKSGGAWVFDNEIDTITGRFHNGDLVQVHDFDGYPMGCGYINQNSKIRVRMLTRKSNRTVDADFLQMRVNRAWEYRKAVMEHADNLNACRLIFGEADFLPGLTVDKYADLLVVECLTLGMEQARVEFRGEELSLKNVVMTHLRERMQEDGFEIRAVYERSDARERDKEGLPKVKQLLWHRDGLTEEEFDPHVEIVENGVHYIVDVKDGQKTGFFLDQKFNRAAMQRIVRGALGCEENLGGAGSLKVLDCFTHMGTFALNCGLAGATDVTGLDISEFAVEQARANAERNGLSDSVHFRAADVLDELPKLGAAGEKYDLVILDPPAFTKSKEATKNAMKGYREINMKGLKLVRDGGYFATCSCSHFMTQDLFVQTIAQAAKAVHKRLIQVEMRTQGPDHPILWTDGNKVTESYYLKFLIFRVCEEK